jgi:hypothetical protein
MTTKTEKVERKTINTIRNEDNPLKIRANKQWPAMYELYREKGNVPGELSGQYTSHALATQAIATYLG